MRFFRDQQRAKHESDDRIPTPFHLISTCFFPLPGVWYILLFVLGTTG